MTFTVEIDSGAFHVRDEFQAARRVHALRTLGLNPTVRDAAGRVIDLATLETPQEPRPAPARPR